MTDLPQVRDVEGCAAVHSLSPGLVSRIPHQPGVQLKAWCLKATLGCCYHLQREWWKQENTIGDILQAPTCASCHRHQEHNTYYPSISTPNVHQCPWPGPQHREDILHLSCGRWDKRQTDFSQGWSDKRSGHRVQSDKRSSHHPGGKETQSASAPAVPGTTLTMTRMCWVQKKFFLWHDPCLSEMLHFINVKLSLTLAQPELHYAKV